MSRDLCTAKGRALAAKHSNAASSKLRLLGVGGRVRLTRHAIESGIRFRSKQTGGVITGFGHHKWTVLVRPDGLKTASAFHVDFWKPEPQ